MSATVRTAPRFGRQEWLVLSQVGTLMSRTFRWILLAVVIVFGLVVGGAAYWSGDTPLWRSALIGLIPAAIVGLLAIAVGVPATVQRQQSSVVAFNAPGHHRVLQRVLGLAWLVTILVICIGAAAMALISAKPVNAAGMAQGMSLATLLAFLMMLSLRMQQLWLFWLVFWLLPRPIRDAAGEQLTLLYTSLGEWSLLVFAGLAWGLHRVLQWAYFRGTASDRAGCAKSFYLQQRSGHNMAAVRPTGNRLADLLNIGLVGRWSLARSRHWTPAARLRLAMGPSWSPWTLLAYVPLLTLAIAVILIWTGTQPLASAADATSFSQGWFIGITAMTASLGGNFMLTLGATRTEQGLAMLLPGAPAPQQRAAWLSTQALRLAAANSAVVVAVSLLTGWALGAPVWALLAMLQVLLAVNVIDLLISQLSPRLFEQAGRASTALIFTKIVLAMMSVAVFMSLRERPDWTWPILALWCSAALLATMILRARRLRGVPAVPVGQFG
jgi:hypothetical protein